MDSSTLLQATLWAVAIIVAYAILSRGLFRAAEDLRSKALDLAVELDASSEFPEVDRQRLRTSLGEFHSTWAAWTIAFRAIAYLFQLPFRRGLLPADDASLKMSKEMAGKFDSYRAYWVFGTVANSLAASVVFLVAGLLAMAFSVSGSALSAMLLRDHQGGGHHNGHARA